ncbi:undecaprenyl-phosphate glucose phosphotransferase [Gangjinia marincola]|uniref:Undecaprenyl-phosphate glucose phosphotransferase n=2 Tax=Gangjinia marincola TaxID=578463 RepID=A0ABP3XTN4_9FLAO
MNTDFYEVYRFTKVTKILTLSIRQFAIFTLIVFAFFGIFNQYNKPVQQIGIYIGIVFSTILIVKLLIFYLLKRFRSTLGGNFRNVVIFGKNRKTRQLKDFFVYNPDYGYKFKALFDVSEKSNELEQHLEYIIEQEIDEIYCSIDKLSQKQLDEIIAFADNNLKVVKFLPDSREIYAKRLNYQYYGYIPILSLRSIPIDEPINQLIKRVFDLFVSTFVILFLLSWLTPILAILIKLESKGPVFFKQKRNGLDYKEFYCYKFRSMKPNPTADIHQVKRNDNRITQIGKVIRKTSIDELPQFINVFRGEMSVVGPRPHMVSHTHMYAERIDKFMVRHFIKPGITGLAQVSGYRGEVESKNDIINRVRHDIFYLENWSILLDLKIILLTIINAIKGEEKAY